MIRAIIFILFAIMCNATQHVPTKLPKPLFEQRNLNVCLESDQDGKTYLKLVALYAPVNSAYFLCGSEMEEDKFRELNPEFTLYWEYHRVRSKDGEECSVVAHFVKDTETGHYKIYEASFLDNWWEMVGAPQIDTDSPTNYLPQQISFDPKKGEYRYAGRSDNDKLLAVKAWKYVQQKRAERRKPKAVGTGTRKKRGKR